MLVLSRQREEVIVILLSLLERLKTALHLPTTAPQGEVIAKLRGMSNEELGKLLQSEEEIDIEVVDIRGEKVRLGISAPNGVPIHRKEVYEAMIREKNATGGSVGSLAGRKQRPGRPPNSRPE